MALAEEGEAAGDDAALAGVVAAEIGINGLGRDVLKPFEPIHLADVSPKNAALVYSSVKTLGGIESGIFGCIDDNMFDLISMFEAH